MFTDTFQKHMQCSQRSPRIGEQPEQRSRIRVYKLDPEDRLFINEDL